MHKRLTACALAILAIGLVSVLSLSGCGKSAKAGEAEGGSEARAKVASVVTAPVSVAGTAGEVTMNKHAERGVSCKQCHESDAPTAAPASNKACFGCHPIDTLIKATASYDDVANKSQNPHDSHAHGVSCFACHKNHADSVLYCDTCHLPAFGWQVP